MMNGTKRLFESTLHAALYARFRPAPSPDIAKFVCGYLEEKLPRSQWTKAIDVGCGKLPLISLV